jgi:hypothetical protein
MLVSLLAALPSRCAKPCETYEQNYFRGVAKRNVLCAGTFSIAKRLTRLAKNSCTGIFIFSR